MLAFIGASEISQTKTWSGRRSISGLLISSPAMVCQVRGYTLTPYATWRYTLAALGVPLMMIDDDTLKQLLRINDALFQLCKWLNDKCDMAISSRLIPLVDD